MERFQTALEFWTFIYMQISSPDRLRSFSEPVEKSSLWQDVAFFSLSGLGRYFTGPEKIDNTNVTQSKRVWKSISSSLSSTYTWSPCPGWHLWPESSYQSKRLIQYIGFGSSFKDVLIMLRTFCGMTAWWFSRMSLFMWWAQSFFSSTVLAWENDNRIKPKRNKRLVQFLGREPVPTWTVCGCFGCL